MKTLIITPLQEEFNFISQSCTRRGFASNESMVGRLPVTCFPDLGLTVAQGGLGKAQFALQTQHLLDARPDWDVVVCVGGTGGLSDRLSIGDVVVATTTIEHDFHNRFGSRQFPRFEGELNTIGDLKSASSPIGSFTVHFGTIASGDEDVVDIDRRQYLRESMGALAVAWEGAGGARACKFSAVPFVEIRGVTDAANHRAPSDFKSNLEFAMDNVATLITNWLRSKAPRHEGEGLG
jgi:adenosylhomocysteine nucleosidase